MTGRQGSDHVTSRVAVGLGAVGAVLAAVQLALIVMSWSYPGVGTWSPRDIALLTTAYGTACATVGFVIVVNRRDNVVGWLLLIGGVANLGWWLTNEYAVWGLIVARGSLPGAHAAVLLSDRLWVLPVGCVIVMLLVFPTGRLLSPAWRPAAAVAVAAMAFVVPTIAFGWELRRPGRVPSDESTIAVLAAAQAIELLSLICVGVGVVSAVASLVVRWRRSEGIERLQLKWLVFAAAITAITLVTGLLVDSRWTRVPLLFALLSIPIAVGVAVLRYRLYEIDRIIRRTVNYAVVSALAVSVFAVVAVIPSVALGLDSDLLVAAATLSAAGVSRPLHARIRKAVDRRFNRSRYDAAETIQDFASRLREDTDVDDLVVEVLDVLRATLEPASAALLLQGPAGTYCATSSSPSDKTMHQHWHLQTPAAPR